MRASRFARSHRTPDRGAIVPVLLGALLLRLWHLGERSLWTDEGSTWTAATAPLPELLRLCAEKDASPPLFYLLTALVTRLGTSEAHLRLVSVLASLGLVWLTYRIARLVAGRRESTLAAALTALAPLQLMYAQEARTYALVGCLTAWSFYLFMRAALSERPRSWLPYVIVTTLALYTQSIAALGLMVQGLIVMGTRNGRRLLVPWALSAALVGLLYLPWAVITLTQMSRLSQSHWYLKPPDERGLFQVLRSVFLSPISLITPPHPVTTPGLDAVLPRRLAQALLLGIPAVPFVAALLTAIQPGKRGSLMRAMLIALVAPLLVVLVASVRVPLWLPRYFVFLTPFFAILTARGLASLHPPALARAWAVLVLALGAYGCIRYDLDFSKERWREVMHAIARQSPPGRTAVLVPFDVDPLRYYNARLGRPAEAVEVSHPDVPFASDYTPRQLEEMERRAAARVAGFDEVWVVVRSPNSAVRKQLVVRANQAAAIGRERAGRWRWDAVRGPVWATRYVRSAGADTAAAARR